MVEPPVHKPFAQVNIQNVCYHKFNLMSKCHIWLKTTTRVREEYGTSFKIFQKKFLVQLRGSFHLQRRHIGSHIVSQNALVGRLAHAEAWAT